MNKPDPKRTQLTPEAFREIAESAIAEVYDNSDSLELHDIRTWNRRMKQALLDQLEYGDADMDCAPDAETVE